MMCAASSAESCIAARDNFTLRPWLHHHVVGAESRGVDVSDLRQELFLTSPHVRAFSFQSLLYEYLMASLV